MFMKKSILYILAASLTVSTLFSACTQNDILYDVDFNVTLDPENTYYAGDPVTFNFEGEVDNLLFYSGESGHEYRYHDRYSIPLDDIESANLHLEIWPRYGKGSLSVWYSSAFTGLKGNDGEADRAAISQMLADGMTGWTQVYTSAENEQSIEETDSPLTADKDVSSALENFSLAFYWDHEDITQTQRHYRVNATLTMLTKSFGTISMSLGDMLMTTVMMNEELSPYHQNAGNGSIRFDSAYDINFQGIGGNQLTYPLKGWVMTTPQQLNAIANDKGEVIKNMQNYMESYSYTFAEPGTYTVTFVGRNANYIGSSELVKEMTVTILNKPLDGGNDGDGADETDPETPAE